MRILISGAGIAGCCLAAFLKKTSHEVTIVERSTGFDHLGYMLSLWPLGTRILIGIDAIERFRRIAAPINTYHVRNGAGDPINSYALADMLRPHGDSGTLTRAELVGLLIDAMGGMPIRMGTTVAALDQDDTAVHVRFDDGTCGDYDLVVGADGIHSGVRKLLLGEIEPYRTGWGGWVWWAPPGVIPVDDVTEHWGAGRFVGLYPTRGRVGVFAGGPLQATAVAQGESRHAHVLELFAQLTGPLKPVFDSLPQDNEDIFFWRLDDVRAPAWHKGRVVLLGDAATAFLPTAGVGASMALESAAVLADELLRVDAGSVTRGLRLFETRHRERVERAQNESRTLAKAMMVSSRPLAWARDELLKHYSIENFIKGLVKSLEEPI